MSAARSHVLSTHDFGAKQHAMFLLQPLIIRSRLLILATSPCMVISEFFRIMHTMLNNHLILPK